jgi:hypothetical protein
VAGTEAADAQIWCPEELFVIYRLAQLAVYFSHVVLQRDKGRAFHRVEVGVLQPLKLRGRVGHQELDVLLPVSHGSARLVEHDLRLGPNLLLGLFHHEGDSMVNNHLACLRCPISLSQCFAQGTVVIVPSFTRVGESI